MKNKKGMTLNQFGGLALGFVLVAIIIAIGGTVLTQTQRTQCSGGVSGYNDTIFGCAVASTTIASNATGQALTGIASMGAWLPTIAVIVAAAVVIGVIVRYFAD